MVINKTKKEFEDLTNKQKLITLAEEIALQANIPTPLVLYEIYIDHLKKKHGNNAAKVYSDWKENKNKKDAFINELRSVDLQMIFYNVINKLDINYKTKFKTGLNLSNIKKIMDDNKYKFSHLRFMYLKQLSKHRIIKIFDEIRSLNSISDELMKRQKNKELQQNYDQLMVEIFNKCVYDKYENPHTETFSNTDYLLAGFGNPIQKFRRHIEICNYEFKHTNSTDNDKLETYIGNQIMSYFGDRDDSYYKTINGLFASALSMLRENKGILDEEDYLLCEDELNSKNNTIHHLINVLCVFPEAFETHPIIKILKDELFIEKVNSWKFRNNNNGRFYGYF